jgi:hypothetical protein
MAKAHAGLPPSNLPDAMTSGIPADQLQANTPAGDPIGLLTGDGEPVPADGQQGGFIDDGIAPPADVQQPADQPREARTIGEMLNNLFGG